MSTENEPEPNGTEEKPRRGRPPNKPKRRNYVQELQELQARVDSALRLLKRQSGGPARDELVAVAVETLEGAA